MIDLDRRTMIGVTCLGCATLAGCGSSSKAGAVATTTTGSSTTPSAAASSAGTGGGVALATLASITVGSAIVAKTSAGPVVVARPTETTAVAFSAKCTHAGCTVAASGATLNCPCHGSKFEATTGKVLNGPAAAPLPPVAVTVSGGQVLLA